MIVNKLNIFSQNVCKNSLIVNSILKTHNHFNIVFIQELLWFAIQSIPSSASNEEEVLVGASNWLSFTRSSTNQSNYPRVIAYINSRLSYLQFSLHRDIINYKDILLISFFSNNIFFFIMNIYSDTFHSALKYLKDTEVNIDNLIIMTDNFNIRDSLWNLSFPHHFSISDNLFILADLSNLELSIPINPIPTRYLDTPGMSNSVLDLIFFCNNSSKLNRHIIHPSWRLTSNHALLTITITIEEEHMMNIKFSLSKNSK